MFLDAASSKDCINISNALAVDQVKDITENLNLSLLTITDHLVDNRNFSKSLHAIFLMLKHMILLLRDTALSLYIKLSEFWQSSCEIDQYLPQNICSCMLPKQTAIS